MLYYTNPMSSSHKSPFGIFEKEPEPKGFFLQLLKSFRPVQHYIMEPAPTNWWTGEVTKGLDVWSQAEHGNCLTFNMPQK